MAYANMLLAYQFGSVSMFLVCINFHNIISTKKTETLNTKASWMFVLCDRPCERSLPVSGSQMSVTNNSLSEDYSHLDYQTRQQTT